MALTPAEKQKAYRKRLKEEAKAAPDAAEPLFAGKFAAFLQKDREHAHELSFIDETLGYVGMHLPSDFETETDPEWEEYGQGSSTPNAGPEWRQPGAPTGWGTPNRGALGRAERMVDSFIDSARALAGLIQQFKLQEIDAALERLSRRKLATPADRKKAFEEHKRLSAIRARLTKEVRHSFPQHVVKGDIDA